MAKYSERRGSWRPDFLVEEFPDCEENYSITEINARFSFNGFMHESYGQQALNDSLHGETSGLVGATDPAMVRHGIVKALLTDSNNR